MFFIIFIILYNLENEKRRNNKRVIHLRVQIVETILTKRIYFNLIKFNPI